MDKKIAKNYIFTVAYQIFVMIVPLITAPYLARKLGAEHQGIASFVTSVSSMVVSYSMLGINYYGNRQIAYTRDDKNRVSETFFEIIALKFVLGLIGTIIYILLSFFYADYTSYFLCYMPWVISNFIDCSFLFTGEEDMKPAVIKNFVNKLIVVACIFIFVHSPNDTLVYLSLLGVANLICNLSFYPLISRYVTKIKVRISDSIKHLKGTLILFLPYATSAIYLYMDKIMVQSITKDITQIAYYDYAEKIINIPLILITSLSTVVMPRLANEFTKGNISKVNQHVVDVGIFSLYIGCPLCIGIFCISSNMIPWYLGNDYLSTATIIKIIASLIIINSIEGIVGRQYLTAIDKTFFLFVSYLITAFINIGINFLLIPQNGVFGAAIATVISNFVCVIAQIIYVRKNINIFALLVAFIKYFIGSLIMGLAIYLITSFFKPGFVLTIVQIVTGITAYFLFCLITRDRHTKVLLNRLKITKK